MSTPTRQIGGVEVFKTLNSTRYERKLYVPENELSQYLPEIGDIADWAPSEAQISGISKTWIAPGAWLLRLSAEASENFGEDSFKSRSLDNYVEKSFTVADIFFHYDWWGLRIAGASDATEFVDDGALIPEATVKYRNIFGYWARQGDYIFRNAIPLRCKEDGTIITLEGKGEADYTRSPFINTAGIALEMVGQTLKTRVYNCTFNTRREPHKISHFVGVSGSFAKSCSPGSDSVGKWKALSQSVRKVRSSDGKIYTSVTRSMIEAPGNLYWDSTKNGGIWTW